jgi:hypothetical protein
MKEWKFRKICLKSKRWRVSIARNYDGHPRIVMWNNGSSKRFVWEAKDEEFQLQEIAMDTQVWK